MAGAAVVLGAAYSYLAAGTKPFTTGADVLTAVPFGVLAAVLVAGWRHRLSPALSSRARMWPWAAVLGVLAAWELCTYAAGLAFGRHAFPTMSSLYDGVAGVRVLKALCFAGWLALGRGLVST